MSEKKIDPGYELTQLPDGELTQALDELAREDPLIWCYWARRIRGRPMTFKANKLLEPAVLADLKARVPYGDYVREVDDRLLRHRPFLAQPLRDQHPHKAYEKARQVGVSELEVSEAIHFLWTHPGTKLITTFPREKQLLDFSTTRIAPVFRESEEIKALLGIPNQVTSKKVGDSFWLLRSAWESGLGEGIDADVVVLDEVDRMKEGVEVAFRESMKASKFGWLRQISTPSLPGRGIDVPFSASDQQIWHVRCDSGHEQEVSYPDNVIQVKEFPIGTKELPVGAYEYLCRRQDCRKPLNRLHGRWVPRHPDKKNIRGYHISQLIAPWISATRLMQNKIDYPFLSMWINYCLGLPSGGDQILLVDADFARASAGHDFVYRRTSDWSRISVGIDWGHQNWVVVMGENAHDSRKYLLAIAMFEDDPERELASVQRIENFLIPYDPDCIVADAGYGKDRNAYLKRKFSPRDQGKFWACSYNSQPKTSKTMVPAFTTPEIARVTVDRTIFLKSICRAIADREFGLPSLNHDLVRLLVRHFKALAPMKEEDEDTREIYEVIGNSGPDHLAHACGYADLAMFWLARNSNWKYDFI